MSTHVTTTLLQSEIEIGLIERELAKVWHLGHKDLGDEQSRSTRARMSNLIVFCGNQEEADSIANDLPLIVKLHPARIIVLIAEEHVEDAAIEASITAHCHRVQGQQVCSEQINVRATGDATRRLPSVARSLITGDLPAALWWVPKQSPGRAGRLFDELCAMVDEVIYDSLGWTDPVSEVTATAAWAHGHDGPHIIADLEWRHLRPWRRLISQALDPQQSASALQTITSVEVDHGPHALPTAWLLIGWLATRLGWTALDGNVIPGKHITWHFEANHGKVPVTVRRIEEGASEIWSTRIGWMRDDGPMSANFAWIGAGRLVADIDDPTVLHRILNVRDLDRAHLLARQLPDLSSDALFLNTLEVSDKMARSII